MGLVKKAIQIGNLTETIVQLKIYNKIDNSLVEFYSNGEHDFDGITKENKNIKQYAKFYNKHDNLIKQIHANVTNHGTASRNSNAPGDLND